MTQQNGRETTTVAPAAAGSADMAAQAAGTSAFRRVVNASSLVLLLALGGCSVPDWANPVAIYDDLFSDDAPQPATLSDQEVEAKKKQLASSDYPNLNEVPDKAPETTKDTAQMQAELQAERDQARATEQQTRSNIAAENAQALSGNAPQPAAPTAPVAPQAPAATGTPMIAQLINPQGAQAQSAPGPMPTPPTAQVNAAPVTSPDAPVNGTVPSAAPAASQQQPAYVPPQPVAPAYPQGANAPVQNSQMFGQYAAPAAPQIPVAPDQTVLAQTFAAQINAQQAPVYRAGSYPNFQPPQAQPINNFAGQVPSIVAETYNQALNASAGAAAGRGDAAIAGSKLIARIKFPNGSAGLSARALKEIARAARAVKEQGGYLRVVGHASSRTKDMPVAKHKIVNFDISLKRAQNVAKALIKRGIPATAILVEAKGDSEPLYFEAMPRGEAENRRVEIYLVN